MKSNIGPKDRMVRMVLGVVLACFALFLQGHLRLLGIAGLVLLVTSVVNWCPLYALFDVDARH